MSRFLLCSHNDLISLLAAKGGVKNLLFCSTADINQGYYVHSLNLIPLSCWKSWPRHTSHALLDLRSHTFTHCSLCGPGTKSFFRHRENATHSSASVSLSTFEKSVPCGLDGKAQKRKPAGDMMCGAAPYMQHTSMHCRNSFLASPVMPICRCPVFNTNIRRPILCPPVTNH